MPEIEVDAVTARGWFLWVAGALIFAASSSPSIAQRVPRLLLPAAGAVGAVLVTAGFVSSVRRLVRRYREAGYPLFRRHRGLDIKGRPGSDVLAAADGRVTVARDNGDLCGLIVVIDHDPDPHGYRTVYCHFSEIAVRVGDTVKRGQRIGAVGTSGQRAWPGFEHVHFEVQRGRDINAIEDPLPRIVGCFDETQRYPAARLVLTYPVKC